MQPEGETCTNYFIFLVSIVCFAGTQCRELKYASLLAGIALIAAFGVAGLQIYIAAAYSPDHGDTHGKGVGDHENHNHGFEVVWDKFGPPDPSSSTASVEMALSLTTAIWAYVPSLLIAELAFEMESPEHLSRSIALSAGLNVATFLAVGLSVWFLWEGGVDDPITLSEAASSPSGACGSGLVPDSPPPSPPPKKNPILQGWPKSSFAGRMLSSLLCLSNFVGYCLDSVPLARWCQRRFVPHFSGQWDMRSVGRYALISAPAWVFGVFAAVFVGALTLAAPFLLRSARASPSPSAGSPSGLFVMLSWVTALTVPACNLIFPSIFTLCALGPPPPAARQAALTRSLMSDVEAPTPGRCIRQSITRTEGVIAACVLLWGLFALVICTYAAIGKTFDPIVRGPQVRPLHEAPISDHIEMRGREPTPHCFDKSTSRYLRSSAARAGASTISVRKFSSAPLLNCVFIVSFPRAVFERRECRGGGLEGSQGSAQGAVAGRHTERTAMRTAGRGEP